MVELSRLVGSKLGVNCIWVKLSFNVVVKDCVISVLLRLGRFLMSMWLWVSMVVRMSVSVECFFIIICLILLSIVL